MQQTVRRPLTVLAGALCLALMAALVWVLVDRARGDAPPVSRPPVQVTPSAPPPAGSEPDELRVHVDNSGPRISVSVRTPRTPWKDRLEVTLGTDTLVVQRRGSGVEVSGELPCPSTVTADAWSLMSRVDLPVRCVADPARVSVTVAVDGGTPVSAAAERTERPNILMLMVDDMRADDLQYMPSTQQLIGEQGVTFSNGFSSFPLCCPARASVLTGLYPHNHGVWSHEPPWGFSSLDDSETAPVWLQRGGYHTTYLGKYLNGYGSTPEPGHQTGTSTSYVPAGWDLWRGSIDGGLPMDHPDEGSTYKFFDTTLNDNGDGYVSLKDEYQTDAYARLTRDQLEANAEEGKPFFSYVSFTAPHHGIPAEADDPPDMVTPARPRRVKGMFDETITKAPGADWLDPDRSDKPERMTRQPDEDIKAQMLEATRQRAESLYVVDEAVKEIIDGLEENGQLDNTVVVFTSDNGYFLGEQGERQGKVLPYEPSLRVPVLMRGPGIPKDEVRTDPFLSIDFPVTFADLGDADAPDVDGVSLVDVARLGDTAAGPSWSRVVLTETNPTRAAQLKLAETQPIGARQTEQMLGKVTGLRTGHYLYVEWQPEPGNKKPGILVELYDMDKDPQQYVNLAVDGKHDALLAELHDELVRARTCRGAECRQPLPEKLR